MKCERESEASLIYSNWGELWEAKRGVGKWEQKKEQVFGVNETQSPF